MIDQLDTRRAQVYIESMIVEVSGDNAADFGFQWQGIVGNKGDTNLLAAGTNFNTGGSNIIQLQTGALTGTAKLGEGINVGLIRNFGGQYALASIARALQSQTNTNIVSTPNQITLDNEEAQIVVGSNVPFITGQYTNTGSATTQQRASRLRAEGACSTVSPSDCRTAAVASRCSSQAPTASARN